MSSFSKSRGCIALACVLTCASAVAQRPTYLPDKVGVWRPWRFSCDGSGHGLTAEQNRSYGEKLHRISEALHQAQLFHPPMGVEVNSTGCSNATIGFLDDYPGNRTGPIPGYVMVGLFSYALRSDNHQVAVADEGPHFFVDVNSVQRLYASRAQLAHDDGGRIFAAPVIVRTISGLPLFDDGSILITKSPRPIFLPVSAERYIQARIHQADTELADMKKRHHELVGEKRTAQLRQTYERIRTTRPQEAESFLRSATDADRKTDQNYSKMEFQKQQEVATYQAELALLSPEQRRTQAYTASPYPSRPGSRLLANPEQPGARPLVCFNAKFFDLSRPRTDIQVLLVAWLYERSLKEKSYDPQYQRVIDFRKSFDFQTLLPLLDQ